MERLANVHEDEQEVKRNKKNEYVAIIHFIDETENIKLQKEYQDSKTCVGIIIVDNYSGLNYNVNRVITALDLRSGNNIAMYF